jgi:hypothetical protein
MPQNKKDMMYSIQIMLNTKVLNQAYNYGWKPITNLQPVSHDTQIQEQSRCCEESQSVPY